MKKFIDIFSSLKLTLALMLGLAVLCIGGTLKAGPDGRFELYYQSIWFRTIFAVFFVNLATCTWKTIKRNLGDPERLGTILASRNSSEENSFALVQEDIPSAATSLREAGYHVKEKNDQLVAQRGRIGRWGSTITHCSCLLIILGAFAAELGFVGTLNIY